MAEGAVRHRWWALGAIAVGLLTVGLDVTILHVALPTLATELRASTGELQWFANAYTLVLAAGLLPAGLLGDQLGQKRLLLGSLVAFGLASIGCAYATSAPWLIVARAALGVGAVFMIPLSISLLTVLFPARERGRAVAMWTTATVLGIPLGPVLGGWLLNHFWWGSVFLVNVPLVVVSVAALAWLLPPTPGAGGWRVDGVGIVLSSAGLVALTYGLIRVGDAGWGPAAVVPVIAGVGALAVFVRWLRRAPRPLFDVGVFRSAGFTSGAMLATVASFAMMGAIFVLPQYFQAVWGTDALGTGLRVLPIIAGLLVGVQVGQLLRRPFDVKVVTATGFALMTVGLVAGASTEVGESYGFVAAWTGVVGLGLGAALPAAMDVALGSLPGGRSGVGSGLVQALRQVGGTLGVAVLGTVLNAGYRAHVNVTGLPAPVADSVRDTAAAGVRVAGSTGSAELLASVRAAFVSGLGAMLLVCAACTLLAALLAWMFVPRQPEDVDDSEQLEQQLVKERSEGDV